MYASLKQNTLSDEDEMMFVRDKDQWGYNWYEKEIQGK